MAFSERLRDGSVVLQAVVSREVPRAVSVGVEIENGDYLAALLDEMHRELGVRERRCVFAVGSHIASLRVMRMPRMSWVERRRAAHFEAERFAHANLEEADLQVRVHPVDRAGGLYAVGVVQRSVLASRCAVLRASRLRAVAADHEAFALRRAFPRAEAVLDIAAERTTLHSYGAHGSASSSVPFGGAVVTSGIARELGIESELAERRKRILGSAGAGLAAREELVAQVAALVERARSRAPMTSLVLTGNGTRLPGLAGEIETASEVRVEMPVSSLLDTQKYPDDVLRAAGPDWSLAAALTQWSLVE
jgi:Tfp pilus assembly PilM family ATPase